MNIANYLTFLRIILAFFCIGFILRNDFNSILIAFVIFIIASLTDMLDGMFARRHNLISDLGKLLDPIADKILIIGVFLAFLQLKVVVNAWMVAVIMLREFIITGLRLYVLKSGKSLKLNAGVSIRLFRKWSVFLLFLFRYSSSVNSRKTILLFSSMEP
jgi:CDP-diacylglycerol--glycerol-3-phosphate 3-phosphatidyltransferase